MGPGHLVYVGPHVGRIFLSAPVKRNTRLVYNRGRAVSKRWSGTLERPGIETPFRGGRGGRRRISS